MTYIDLAKSMLDRGMVDSRSTDPVTSIATTIAKDVREDRNDVGLVIVDRRPITVGLPEWTTRPGSSAQEGRIERTTDRVPAMNNLRLRLPVSLIEKIELAVQAKVADTRDETIALIVERGLAELSPIVKQRLLDRLQDF